MADHVIVIRHEPFGYGFDITVEPAPSTGPFDQERPDVFAAREYAQGLRAAHGWTIRDETAEPA